MNPVFAGGSLITRTRIQPTDMRQLNLTRSFSLLAFILMMIAATALVQWVRSQEINQMTQTAQDRNVSLTRVFRTFLASEIDALILLHDVQTTQPSDQADRTLHLRSKIAEVSNDSGIFKLKIYNTKGVTIFSTDLYQVGEDKSTNPGFLTALEGQVASDLVHRNQISAFDRDLHNIDLVSSYVPIVQQGRVTAVVEVYQDVTQLIRRIDDTLWQVWLIVLAVLTPLYIMLLLVVRNGQRLLQRNQELLEISNYELDQRVKERTAELLKNETRFRSLSEMSSDFFWETDADHRFTLRTLSQQETEHANYLKDAFIGKFRWEVPYCAPDEDTWQEHRNVLNAHLPFRNFEISRLDANAQVRHISASGDPQFNALGEFTGYLGVGSDITLRKQVEADLRIAAAAFESQEAMMVTDANSVILRINQAFTDITGYNSDEVVGKTPKLLSSGRHDASFYRDMWQAIRRDGVWKGEIWDRRKNGDVYPKWLTISAVRDCHGTVTHYIGTHYDITEQKKTEEKIQALAFFDSLTGLPNRTLLRDRLKQAMAACNRNASMGALLFIDLDHFKTLNDTLGHDKGDLLLQQVAQRLLTSVREGDTVARLGGDEFVVILKNLGENPQEAAPLTQQLGEKILAVLNQSYHLGTVDHRNSASIGATVFSGHETSLDDLLKQADMAMYQSKNAGRNALYFFDPAMQQTLLERAALEADLRAALQQEQLELYYQPQVSNADEIYGAEALLRWNHPLRGRVSPIEFIALAEETGLILPLGSWVLETACKQLATWANHPQLSKLTIAVNVSARQMRHADFVNQVLGIVGSTHAPVQRLKLELTESLLVDNIEDISAKMKALKAHGVGFSLDDFGTGYSSLSYLSQLPLDQLKIDRSFVMHIDSKDHSIAICAAIISMAHNLRLKVVAEGVETEAQRYILNTVHHCDYIQGYLYSRPLPVTEFEAFVAKQSVSVSEVTRRKNT